MEKITDKTLIELIKKTVDTLSWYGAELVRVDLDSDPIPHVYVNLYKKKLKKSKKETLQIVYWAFWSFFYGAYSPEKEQDYKLILDYQELK